MAKVIPTIDIRGVGDLTCGAGTTTFDTGLPNGGVVKTVVIHIQNWGYLEMSRKETINLMKKLGKLLNVQVGT